MVARLAAVGSVCGRAEEGRGLEHHLVTAAAVRGDARSEQPGGTVPSPRVCASAQVMATRVDACTWGLDGVGGRRPRGSRLRAGGGGRGHAHHPMTAEAVRGGAWGEQSGGTAPSPCVRATAQVMATRADACTRGPRRTHTGHSGRMHVHTWAGSAAKARWPAGRGAGAVHRCAHPLDTCVDTGRTYTLLRSNGPRAGGRARGNSV